MTLETSVLALSAKVGEDIGKIIKEFGDLSTLTTQQKSSLVAALNGVQQTVNDIIAFGESEFNRLDDTQVGLGVFWSADKILSQIALTKDSLIDGAPANLDTLKEIADALSKNDTAVADLYSAMVGTVQTDAAQNLSAVEQFMACNNIDIGDITVNVDEKYYIASDINTYVEPGYAEPGYFA